MYTFETWRKTRLAPQPIEMSYSKFKEFLHKAAFIDWAAHAVFASRQPRPANNPSSLTH